MGLTQARPNYITNVMNGMEGEDAKQVPKFRCLECNFYIKVQEIYEREIQIKSHLFQFTQLHITHLGRRSSSVVVIQL